MIMGIWAGIPSPYNVALPPDPEPEFTWYDVPLGGADNAFIGGQFYNETITLPGTITGATKIRLVGTWQGTYYQGNLIIRGYPDGDYSTEATPVMRLSYRQRFGSEDWSGTIDVVLPIKPTAGDVDGQPGLYGFFPGGSIISRIRILDGVGTGITGINIKLQIDVPFTKE